VDPSASYLSLAATGELATRVAAAYRHFEDCDLCGRYCRVNRRGGIEDAVCRTSERAVVASYGAHHGEEIPLRGWGGSGTILFSWYNLRCVACQNWDISQRDIGREVEPREIAYMMLELQADGCHNINLVSPSHVVAQIIAAVNDAAARGLRLPLVYNTGSYDSLVALAIAAMHGLTRPDRRRPYVPSRREAR
jgi:putative pyruvate formate lyase activating enzyme